MKMISLCLCVFSITCASASSLFTNEKEGASYLIGKSERKKISSVLKKVSSEDIVELFEEELQDDRATGCSFKLITNIKREFESKFSRSFNRYDRGVYYHVREKNLIDDVVLKILLNGRKVLNASTNRPQKKGHYPSFSKTRKVFEAIYEWQEKNSNGECLTTSWKKLHDAVTSIHSNLNQDQIDEWLKFAYQRGVINYREMNLLQKANYGKLHNWSIDLSTYKSKRKYLLRHFPVEDIDRSDFISQEMPSDSFFIVKLFEEKVSYRERLYNQYSPKQMVFLSNFINRLKERINAMSVNINVLDFDGEILEVIELTPMEQYRFAGKMVRRELIKLKSHTLFKDTNVNYLDLVSAAFEIGGLQSVELEFIAEVEDLWNPKKSKKEKLISLATKYGPIGALMLPPGVQYVVPLALVVIEVMAKDDKHDGADDEYNLF